MKRKISSASAMAREWRSGPDLAEVYDRGFPCWLRLRVIGVELGFWLELGLGFWLVSELGLELELVFRSRWGSCRGCSVDECVFELCLGVSQRAVSARRRRVLYW
jgi:hypothetical protein